MEKILGREDILGIVDTQYEFVDVPEWGGKVRMRGLSGNERDRYEQSIVELRGGNVLPKFANARARLAAWSIVNENGDRIFTDADIAVLGRKSAAALERVYEAARKLSGLSERDIEELVGNSDGVQSDGSTSDSLSPSDAP